MKLQPCSQGPLFTRTGNEVENSIKVGTVVGTCKSAIRDHNISINRTREIYYGNYTIRVKVSELKIHYSPKTLQENEITRSSDEKKKCWVIVEERIHFDIFFIDNLAFLLGQQTSIVSDIRKGTLYRFCSINRERRDDKGVVVQAVESKIQYVKLRWSEIFCCWPPTWRIRRHMKIFVSLLYLVLIQMQRCHRYQIILQFYLLNVKKRCWK